MLEEVQPGSQEEGCAAADGSDTPPIDSDGWDDIGV